MFLLNQNYDELTNNFVNRVVIVKFYKSKASFLVGLLFRYDIYWSDGSKLREVLLKVVLFNIIPQSTHKQLFDSWTSFRFSNQLNWQIFLKLRSKKYFVGSYISRDSTLGFNLTTIYSVRACCLGVINHASPGIRDKTKSSWPNKQK